MPSNFPPLNISQLVGGLTSGGAAALPVKVNADADGVTGHLVVDTGIAGTQVQASTISVAAAACVATLPAAVGKTTYITGFSVTTGPAVAAVSGLVTVTGPSTTLNYYVTEGTTNGGELLIIFPDPIPASATNTAIVVTLPAISGGAVSAVTATGYQF